jgi:hypothetical protein
VRAIVVLSITMVIAWGTLFYGVTLIGQRVMAETGWSKTLIYGAFSLALLVSGLAAPRIGAMIDARGGRLVMTMGSLVGGLGYAILGVTDSIFMLYLAYAVIGLGMAGSLYDPAFAALARICGSRARSAITILTLAGGLASTVFWPLGLWLLEFMDWRGLCFVYAALNGVVCAVLHMIGVSSDRAPAAEGGAARTGDLPLIPPALRNRAILILALVFMSVGIVSNAVSVHLVALMGSLGLSETEAVAMGVVFGPAQSAGRLIELMLGGAYPVMRLGYVSVGLMPLAFGLLLAAGGAAGVIYAFAVGYGLANGLTTIARGVMVLGLLGRENYGRTLGAIAAPTLVAKAATPTAFALLIDSFGAQAALWTMFGLSLASLAAVGWLGALVRRSGQP